MENSNPEETPQPPFRFNLKVVQVAALVLVALALPLTMAILGILDIRKSRSAANSEPAPEIPALRGALETAVDAQWTAPDLSGGTRKMVREVADGDTCLRVGDAVQELARKINATVLSPEKIEEGGTRWILQVPADQVAAFEAGLGELGFRGFTDSTEYPAATLYEVEIPIRR